MYKSRLASCFLLMLSVAMLCPRNLSAETIYLKSGKKIEANIIEKTDRFIKADIGGVTVTFFLDQIDKIEDRQIVAATVPNEPIDSGGELYVEQRYGFEIRGPKGWILHIAPPIRGSVALFNQNKSPKERFPSMSISIDGLPGQKTLMDFAQEVISDQERIMGMKVVEKPHEIRVGDINGVRFIVESPIGQYGWSLRNTQYVFRKDGAVISVMYMNKSPEFERYLKDFEETVSTFKFLAPEDDFLELKKLTKALPILKPVENAVWGGLKKDVVDNMQTKNSFTAAFALKNKTNQKLAQNDFLSMSWYMTFISPESFEIEQRDYDNNVGDIWRISGDDLYIKVGVWMPMPTEIETTQAQAQKNIQDMLRARKEIYKMLSFGKYLDMLKTNAPVSLGQSPEGGYSVAQFNLSGTDDLFTGQAREGSFTTEVWLWIADKDKTLRLARTVIEGKDKDGKYVKEEYEHYFTNYNFLFKLGKPEMSWMESEK